MFAFIEINVFSIELHGEYIPVSKKRFDFQTLRNSSTTLHYNFCYNYLNMSTKWREHNATLCFFNATF